MSAALAGLAAALAAVGVAELAASRARRPARHRALAWLAAAGRRLGPLAPPTDLAARLVAAGEPLRLTVADVMAVKAGAALAGLLAAGPLAAALPGRLPLVATVAGPVAGFLAPDLWVSARIRARARTMSRELPDLLDLLRVSVEAGLSLERGLGEVGRRHAGLLAGEWRRAATELALGVPRTEAVARLRARCPAEGMPAFVAALDRAARHGVPLSGTLAGQARDARAARARRIREDAARAAPKIQLVVALALVPSVLLLVAAALVAALVG